MHAKGPEENSNVAEEVVDLMAYQSPKTQIDNSTSALKLKSTLMLIFVAFICEHGHLLPVEEVKDTLVWLSQSLKLYHGICFHRI